jgi:hypothetical protein
MTTTTTEQQVRDQITWLAQDMVRLEDWARHAYMSRNYVRVGELHTQREEVQAERSFLMRGLWLQASRRRKRDSRTR